MLTLLALPALIYFCRKRLFRYLRYLQQEEYQSFRFVKWLYTQNAWDTKGAAICLFSALVSLFSPLLAALLGASALAYCAFWEEDPSKRGKIRLKMTARAWRIMRVSFTLLSLFLIASAYFLDSSLFWLAGGIAVEAVPFTLMLAVFLLSRDETRRQRKYREQAKATLRNIDPFVIGITGSFGKTSVKSALGELLQITLGPTFWPPKSINTPMGITREIRERLKRGHAFAVIEMGAYGIGSIERLAALTPPKAAIITAVGSMHLERFGSQEAVFKAKSELAKAVPNDGILVCNGDDPKVRQIAESYPKKTTLLYGLNSNDQSLDCRVLTFSITAKGTSFTLIWKDKEYQGFTPLYGRTALSNILAAFTMACALGADPHLALAVIRNLEPVDNRLQVAAHDKVTYIHDAYNSNPLGFMAALEVMQMLPGKRKILMTPGMIELGTTQNQENRQVARKAAGFCDLALIVGETNRESLSEGFKMEGFAPEKILFCSTTQAAFSLLESHKQAGDVILIENDLSDLYEAPSTF